MRLSRLAVVTSSPGLTSAHNLLRAKPRDRAAGVVVVKRLRMLHVGGSENVRLGAASDLVFEQARGPVFGLDFVAGFGFVGLGHVGQGTAQAAGGVEMDGFGKGHGGIGPQ